MIPERTRSVATDRGEDRVVLEEPLLIEVGEDSILTMRTPGHDAELARGFLLGEGILEDPATIARLETLPRSGGEGPVDRVRVHLVPGFSPGPVARERLSRAHAIRPSCGICGLVSAEGLTRHLAPLQPGRPRVRLSALRAMVAGMRAEQLVFQATGGCHAAALFAAETGELWGVREDVGRHNAVDKVLGQALAAGRDLGTAALILSGRAGYELVLKALRLRVPIVGAVSAPSSLAVELADEHGQTLVGFLREGGGRVYADDERLEEGP